MVAPSLQFWGRLSEFGLDRASARLDRSIKRGAAAECWPFHGKDLVRGYGRIKLRGRRFLTHRLAWALANRRDPGEMIVCHTCDNRACCNPAHLWLGTTLDNNRDMAAKGRRARQDFSTRRKRTDRLTPEAVRSIRADTRTNKEIAAEYGLSASYISVVRSGARWIHVQAAVPPAALPARTTRAFYNADQPHTGGGMGLVRGELRDPEVWPLSHRNQGG